MGTEQNEQNVEKYNTMLTQLNNLISCGADCQYENEANRLKGLYEESIINADSASSQIEASRQAYLTYTEGESGAQEYITDEKGKMANGISQEYTKVFEETSGKIKSLVTKNQGILDNFKNVVDLYLKYKEENMKMERGLKNTTSDMLTNERKTFYQDQQSEILKFYYYYVILTIYIICIICFGIFSLIFPSQTDWKIRFASFIALILLPFVSTWLLGIIVYIIYGIYNMLPKNVYKKEVDEFIEVNKIKNI